MSQSIPTTPVGSASFPSLANILPAGGEKVFKQAFINTVTVLCVLSVVVTTIAVFFVLQPFIRPLLWSLLAGSALFPFKQKLTQVTKRWINQTKQSPTPLLVQSVTLPFTVLSWMMDEVIEIMTFYSRILVLIFCTLLTIHLFMYYFTVTQIVFTFLTQVMSGLLHIYVLLAAIPLIPLIIALISLFVFSPPSLPFLSLASPLFLISLSGKLPLLLGHTMSTTLIGGVGCVALLGWLSTLLHSEPATPDSDLTDHKPNALPFLAHLFLSIRYRCRTLVKYLLPYRKVSTPIDPVTGLDRPDSPSSDADSLDTETQSIASTSTNEGSPSITPETRPSKNVTLSPTIQVDESDKGFSKKVTSTPLVSPVKTPRKRMNWKETVDALKYQNKKRRNYEHLSNAYMYSLVWTCLLAYVWSNPHILILFPIPVLFLIMRFCYRRLSMSPFPTGITSHLNRIKGWFDYRKDILIHPILKKLFNYLILGDTFITGMVDDSLDALCSLSVIMLVLVGILLASLFLAFQIYGESIHLVHVFGNIVNSTLTSHPELNSLFTQNTAESNMTLFDEMIGNAYVIGRKWIKKTLRNVLNADDASINASMAIERQLLEAWDRSYQMWIMKENSSDPGLANFIKAKHLNHLQEEYNWDTLMGAFKNLDFSLCFNLLKENLDTVMSVLESIWVIMKGNISLFISLLTAISSLLMSGSSAILNGAINFIVFSTSLFYLLCASETQYKPIDWVSRVFPSTSVGENRRSNRFLKAFDEGINSVFEASFKMATFYGMYTWLIHTLFQARLVYIPSLLASIFGAAPFIGSYWASLPAVLELWLIHGLTWKAIMMAGMALFPMYVVDSAIYAEIKGGGHPYLTGLAIAGGVFFLGFEGAIVGPVLLCILFVAMNFYTSIMSETDDDPPSRTPNINRTIQRMNTSVN